jgi:hypothetical protein
METGSLRTGSIAKIQLSGPETMGQGHYQPDIQPIRRCVQMPVVERRFRGHQHCVWFSSARMAAPSCSEV